MKKSVLLVLLLFWDWFQALFGPGLELPEDDISYPACKKWCAVWNEYGRDDICLALCEGKKVGLHLNKKRHRR